MRERSYLPPDTEPRRAARKGHKPCPAHDGRVWTRAVRHSSPPFSGPIGILHTKEDELGFMAPRPSYRRHRPAPWLPAPLPAAVPRRRGRQRHSPGGRSLSIGVGYLLSVHANVEWWGRPAMLPTALHQPSSVVFGSLNARKIISSPTTFGRDAASCNGWPLAAATSTRAATGRAYPRVSRAS
jgi:hypothetical protein